MESKSHNSSIPSLCELEEFTHILKEIWDTRVLTHNGPYLQRLENEICKSLDINYYIAVANGTTALQLAIEALDIKGTILVPAFSWIATASAVKWQDCKIKFCDINPKTLNICPDSIEKNIDKSVEAIMPVHVFGNPCDVQAIKTISKKHNLKLIYDAAHAFGTTLNNKSILSYGDISCVSTHATKIFNTAEGGGLICNLKEINNKIDSLRFFGFDKNKNIITNGINAKMTEIHAALGLANLKKFRKSMIHRKKLDNIYRNELFKCKRLSFQDIDAGSNCSYFPIIVEDKQVCIKLVEFLSSYNIFPRKYFFPSLNKIKILSAYQSCPISESISKRILCLPSHDMISVDDAIFISRIINKFI